MRKSSHLTVGILVLLEAFASNIIFFIGDNMEWIFIDGKQIPLEEYIEMYGDLDE